MGGMDRFFSIFGKVALVLLIIGTVGFGSYYLGQKRNIATTNIVPTESQDELTINIVPSLSETPVSSPAIVLKTISGGVLPKAGLSFSQYSITVPSGWTELVESQTPNDEKLTLAKDGNQISIFQAATGGAMCLYPTDADFEGPSSRYTNFTELKTADGTVLRRSGSDIPGKDGRTGFTVCQKSPDGGYGQPTIFGHISYSLPENYDQKMLLEMDSIVSSLQKK